jgi:hypothetical protein
MELVIQKLRYPRPIKRVSCKAREKSTSGGVLKQYVGARRSSATKQMGLFSGLVRRNSWHKAEWEIY